MVELPPIFVVNLPEDTEKRTRMRRVLDQLGLEYQFIEAVNGQKIAGEELERVYDPRISQHYLGRGLVPGEIGCYMSHVKAYEIISTRDIPYALILEDDVEVSPDIVPFLKNLDKLPEDWEVISLSELERLEHPNPQYWYRKTWKIYGEYKVGMMHGELYGTQGYLIRKEMAKHCLSSAYPTGLPIDSLLFNIETSISSFHSLKGKRLVREKTGVGFGSRIQKERARASLEIEYPEPDIRVFPLSRYFYGAKALLRYKVFFSMYVIFLGLTVYFLPTNSKKPKPVYTKNQFGKIKERIRFTLRLYYGFKNEHYWTPPGNSWKKPQFTILVISLEKDKVRRKHISEVLNQLNLSFEFIDAIDGKELPTEEINEKYRGEIAHELVGRQLTKEEIGCYMSHIKAYKTISERNIPYALILEDDVDVSPDIVPFFGGLPSLSDWEVINLSGFLDLSVHKSWYQEIIQSVWELQSWNCSREALWGLWVHNKKGIGRILYLQRISDFNAN